MSNVAQESDPNGGCEGTGTVSDSVDSSEPDEGSAERGHAVNELCIAEQAAKNAYTDAQRCLAQALETGEVPEPILFAYSDARVAFIQVRARMVRFVHPTYQHPTLRQGGDGTGTSNCS